MAHESFEDAEVAAKLNQSYICIKVDKEERPDIDAVYMNTCQILTGSGGWPLTILMAPDQRPFYAGTYLPKHRRYRHMGLMDLLDIVSEKWNSDQESLLQSGQKITLALQELDAPLAEDALANPSALKQVAAHFHNTFDHKYGGFGSAPKFPMPHNFLFLLRCHHFHISSTLHMVEHTLTSMLKGGIFDHIGLGFARYSTDEKWLAPHFEKMLYDNALLVIALLECYQVTQNACYRQAAEKTLCYIEQEMTSPQGGFYSAQDADSEGQEGKFYTFTPDEVREVLGEEEARRYCERYDITKAGNFEGQNIPNLIENDALLFDEAMEQSRRKLYAYRQKRYALHKDDKVLTSWNALMIAAHAKAYQILGTINYLESAKKSLCFIQSHLMDAEGHLLVSYRDGTAKGIGLLDDYAFLLWACLELYSATYDVAYLTQAGALADTMLHRFAAKSGGFYLNPEDGEQLIYRPLELSDGAMPSGNSVAAWCLARLAALTGEQKWQDAAQKQLRAYSNAFLRQPWAYTFALTALMQELYPTQQLICMVKDAQEANTIAVQLGQHFQPGLSALFITPENKEQLQTIAPFIKDYHTDGDRTFFLCRNQRCAAPVHDFCVVLQMLKESQEET